MRRLRIVLAHTALLPTEQVPLVEAAGRILAADFIAGADFPPFPASTMDGYAVIANDGSPWRDVVGVQAAGQLIDAEVTPGTAIKIMTGAPLPKRCGRGGEGRKHRNRRRHVIIHQEFVEPGESIRQIGSDVKAGQLLVRAGSKIGPAEIGLLAAYGGDPVTVRRKPKVSIVSTGDELLEPSEPLAPGKIRDSNRYMLRVRARSGGSRGDLGRQRARCPRRAGAAARSSLIADSDIVITSGGVSMGDLDLIKPILLDLATVHFRRVFLKPGKPLNFATCRPDADLRTAGKSGLGAGGVRSLRPERHPQDDRQRRGSRNSARHAGRRYRANRPGRVSARDSVGRLRTASWSQSQTARRALLAWRPSSARTR